MDAIKPEVQEMRSNIRQIAKYFLKVDPFARVQKIYGVDVKSRCGNTHFTKKVISIISYSHVADGWLVIR